MNPQEIDPALADRHRRRGRVITLVGLAGLAALYVLALVFTPPERYQGMAQKIYYLHPPAAYAMQLAFALMGIASVLYLLMRDRRFDLFAEASAEVGLVLSVIVMLTGPIWGKPIWGAWWRWSDPRLMFTAIEALTVCGYFALRSGVRDADERARFSAVVGIMSLVLVPFNHLTVYLFATQHPKPVCISTEGCNLPPDMLPTFLTAFGVFTILYLGFVLQRYAIALHRTIAEEREV